MRVLKKDLRGEEGEIALLPESLDDLWHLRHLVEGRPGIRPEPEKGSSDC